jgi:chromate reductase
MDAVDVAVLVGSLRRESLSRKIALELIGLAPASLRMAIVGIGDLPLYNQDAEEEEPEAWNLFRTRMRVAQAVLFVTPEYNRSMPAAIKNALDVGSRPYVRSVWGGKPGAVVSVSPGAIGGFGANHHLRQCLVPLNMPVLPQPEVYLGGADKLLDASGRLSNPATREFLGRFMQAFAAWVDLHLRR